MRPPYVICPVCNREFIPKTSWVCCSRPCSIFYHARKRVYTAYLNYRNAERRFQRVKEMYKTNKLPTTSKAKVEG
jgi:predicted nucleic acid-binding Zn ribbon protein